MTHPRQTIRQNIVALLDNGSVVASGAVHSNRTLNVAISDLPLLNVTATNEESVVHSFDSQVLERRATFIVEAVQQVTDDAVIDDRLDDLAQGIESRMRSDTSLAEAAIDCILTGTEIEIEEPAAEVTLGRIRLSYLVTYLY